MRHSSQRSSLIITEQRRMNMGKLTYIRCGDYDIPNLKLYALGGADEHINGTD